MGKLLFGQAAQNTAVLKGQIVTLFQTRTFPSQTAPHDLPANFGLSMHNSGQISAVRLPGSHDLLQFKAIYAMPCMHQDLGNLFAFHARLEPNSRSTSTLSLDFSVDVALKCQNRHVRVGAGAKELETQECSLLVF